MTEDHPKAEETNLPSHLSAEDEAAAFFTWRGILLGVVMCVIMGITGPYWRFYLHGSLLYADYSMGGVLFFLFVLVLLLNGLLGRFWPGVVLKPGELVVVGVMMFAGGSVACMGLVRYFASTITGPYYFANPVNQWETELWPYLAKWMSPLDKGGGTSTIEKFYLGLAAGESIPWQPWIKPLLLWSIFLVALFLCTMAIMTLVRKQWMDYEHLSFPIAQLPQSFCQAASDVWGKRSILADRLFWIGVAIPFSLAIVKGLHWYFPAVPQLRLDHHFNGLVRMHITFSFAVLGFTYLIPSRIALSLWVFNLISLVVRWHILKYGLGMQEHLAIYGAGPWPEMAHQGTGAMVVLVIGGLWLGRRHLLRALRCAFGIGDRDYDRNEPTSYRAALIQIAVSVVVMVVWLRATGLTTVNASLFVLVVLMVFYGLSRIVAQCGLAVTISPMIPPDIVTTTVGPGNVTGSGLSSLGMAWLWCSDLRINTMTTVAHGMYLARRRARGLIWIMMLGLAASAITGMVFTIGLGYRLGALNLEGWSFIQGPVLSFRWALHNIQQGGGPSAQVYFWTGLGGAIMTGLLVMQRLFFWWPLHPVAYVVCSVVWTDHLWFTFFLAWLTKTIIVRLGGNRMFRRGRAFFLGMILGQYLSGGFWNMIGTITGQSGGIYRL